jgi:hypothetical protein
MMKKRREITLEQARRVGDCLYLDWNQVDLGRFRRALMGSQLQDRDYHGVTMAGRAVLRHMDQIPDYLVRLARLRAEAQAQHGTTRPE